VSDYPPKLVRISETDFGSVLVLNDDTEVSIDVRPARLNEVMIEYGLEPLVELVSRRSVGVFVDLLAMTTEQWTRISESVRSSPEAAAALQRFPVLWASFGEPYNTIVGKVHRLYGGLSRFLYTSHPFDFRADPNRPLPWYRALLSARGGWLFNTWVHLGTGAVEIEAEQHRRHYVE